MKTIQEYQVSGRHGGRRTGAGRPKGRVSQETADIRELVVGALHDVGGRDYLAARAIDTPTAFMALIGKVLPLQLTGENGGALLVDFRWADAPVVPVATIDAKPLVADETTDANTNIVDVTFIEEC